MEANLISCELTSCFFSSISKQARNRRHAPRWNNVIRTHYGCFILLHSVFCVQLLGCWPTLSGKDINSASKDLQNAMKRWVHLRLVICQERAPRLGQWLQDWWRTWFKWQRLWVWDGPLEERRTGRRKMTLQWNVFFNNELYSGFLKSKVQALIWSAATAGSHQTKITQMSKNIKMVNVNDYK